jgi:hypothetical protein
LKAILDGRGTGGELKVLKSLKCSFKKIRIIMDYF